MDFDTYLKELADHEDEKSKTFLKGPRDVILVNAGIRLNWLGDFFANPDIKWELKTIPITDILFTGTEPEVNEVLLKKCERKPENLIPYLETDPKAKELIYQRASHGKEPILLRKREDKYLVLDGMHRFVGAVLDSKENIEGFVAINDGEILPNCEAHVIYDLIRGYQRHAKDEEGKENLYRALKLLNRVYANVGPLLKERFNEKYVNDEDVQEVIEKIVG